MGKNYPLSLSQRIKHFFISHGFLGFLGLFSGLALFILMLFFGNLPFLSLLAINSAVLAMGCVVGFHFYKKALVDLVKKKSMGIDLVLVLAALLIIAVSVASVFIPWLPLMIEAPLFIFGFRHLSLVLEPYLQAKVKTCKNYSDELPDFVMVRAEDGLFHTKKLSKVIAGDVLMIGAGEVIPVNGSIISGENEVLIQLAPREAGEEVKNKLYRFCRGQNLLSGMRLHSGEILLKVTKTVEESHVKKMDYALYNALQEEAPIEQKIESYAKVFLPLVFGFAAIGFCVALFFYTPALAIQIGIMLLVAASTLIFRPIAPLTINIAMHKSAQYGILFQNKETLEKLQKIDTLVFSLGALTTGMPKKLKPDAAALVATAMAQGKEVHLCTGAKDSVAAYFAAQLKIPADNVGSNKASHEEAKPSKPAYVRALRAQGKSVAWVGDYKSDSEAISQSDIAFTFGTHPIPQKHLENSNGMIQIASLNHIHAAMHLATNTFTHIKKSAALNLGLNIVMIASLATVFLGAGIIVTPGIGAALLSFQMLFLFGYAHYFQKKPLHYASTKTSSSYKDMAQALKIEPCMPDFLRSNSFQSESKPYYSLQSRPSMSLSRIDRDEHKEEMERLSISINSQT